MTKLTIMLIVYTCIQTKMANSWQTHVWAYAQRVGPSYFQALFFWLSRQKKKNIYICKYSTQSPTIYLGGADETLDVWSRFVFCNGPKYSV